MEFAGLVTQTLVDYPGEIAAILFTRGCNIRCPFCHNPHLLVRTSRNAEPSVTMQEIEDFLQEHKGFLDAVVITGGEPTLHPDLPDVIRIIKGMGYLVKLDSNGTNPVMLQQLMEEQLLDYVAMDIKAPLDYRKYSNACGKLSTEDFFNIRSSVNLLMNSSLQVEFRTTIVPPLHTPEDIEDIAKYIKGAPLYTLQQFNPSVTWDAAYGDVAPYSKEEMQAIADLAAPYVKSIRIVNI
ncbi:MAG: anaerobic ribonucleoside-triphosphate reductase activating protein [Syntrophomonadaceae bacterium]|nr:anaerobic ribonucleoside-triphosphate reductase activating protein [Syntrophomonadaceae bacterium]